MNTSSHPIATTPSPKRSRVNGFTVVAFVAGAALAGIAGAVAGSSGGAPMHMGGWHHGMMEGAHSTADVTAHVDHMLKHLYVEIDATDAQQAQITPLVNHAVNDLMPLHALLQAAHNQAIEGLTQATIDRSALEAMRITHLQLADQASKRLVQLIADVGEALTPAQRNALATHLKQMHGIAAP